MSGNSFKFAWWRGRQAEALAIAAVVLALAFLPGPPHGLPCPILWLTGHECPTCGTTRAVWAILHGQWERALHWNPIGFLVMIVIMRRLVTLAWPAFKAVAWANHSHVNATLMASYFVLGFMHLR